MKRINIIGGHYGSGKTNIAVNMAFEMKKRGLDALIADLDIVNPYFRAKDSEKQLKAAGIKLISSVYAASNIDLPSIPGEVYSILDNKKQYAVIDLGGDNCGAYALGRYAERIREENNYDFFFVFNCFRPLTPNETSALRVMREIEEACNIKFTAIINNSNIGCLTTEETLKKSVKISQNLSLAASLPLKFTCVEKTLYDTLQDEYGDIFPLILQKKIV